MPHDGGGRFVDGEQGLILEPERTQVRDSLPGSKQFDHMLGKGVGLGMDEEDAGIVWGGHPSTPATARTARRRDSAGETS